VVQLTEQNQNLALFCELHGVNIGFWHQGDSLKYVVFSPFGFYEI